MVSSGYDYLPLLGRGSHWSPRFGACFMELASYLAGERWSDHPACTHPLLAHLARCVNDCISDDARPRLAVLVPSVIGLTSGDPVWDHELTLLAAAHAFPVAAEPHQRALAVGMLACERLYAPLAGRPAGSQSSRTRAAFAEAPLAQQWARDFMARTRSDGSGHPGPLVVELAARAIAEACVGDADERLERLLTEAVDLCLGLARLDRAGVDDLDFERWSRICRPVQVVA